ncbi:uncharacterized protein NPIL_456491 [Nephila pilipes]|uniref:Uncharacterized protein n=1 Tax=Nephila pilipes TaxID=299642 RepID=A0A8X6Q231_NEPPI|nr:uncharacterized protein NPIL_456491 [Nephila pilipes]
MFEEDQPKCYEMLNSFLYVDDLFYGANTAWEAYELTSTTIEILEAAALYLKRLKTNCSELRTLWIRNGYEENTNCSQGTGFLGLKWDPNEDRIKLNFQDIRASFDVRVTKRHVLRIISRNFDPCGIISPFVMTVKILLQEMWERGLKWHDDLPIDLERKWKTWCSELSKLELVSIERKLFGSAKVNEIFLHLFCDANPKTYGAVAFLRYIN